MLPLPLPQLQTVTLVTSVALSLNLLFSLFHHKHEFFTRCTLSSLKVSSQFFHLGSSDSNAGWSRGVALAEKEWYMDHLFWMHSGLSFLVPLGVFKEYMSTPWWFKSVCKRGLFYTNLSNNHWLELFKTDFSAIVIPSLKCRPFLIRRKRSRFSKLTEQDHMSTGLVALWGQMAFLQSFSLMYI